MAAQLILIRIVSSRRIIMNGINHQLFTVPVSPVIKIVVVDGATLFMASNIFSMALLAPIIPALSISSGGKKLHFPLKCGFNCLEMTC